MKSQIIARLMDGTEIPIRDAPEGYEFTGEYKFPGPDDYWLCKENKALHGRVGVRALILRRLITVKEQRERDRPPFGNRRMHGGMKKNKFVEEPRSWYSIYADEADKFLRLHQASVTVASDYARAIADGDMERARRINQSNQECGGR